MRYAVDAMGGDKLTNLMNIAEVVVGLDKATHRIISLASPYSQYCLLEDIILAAEDMDKRLCDMLTELNIPLPVKYGWRRVTYTNGEKYGEDTNEWFEDKHNCYASMYKDAMRLIGDAIGCLNDSAITITSKGFEGITVTSEAFKDVYELYEI